MKNIYKTISLVILLSLIGCGGSDGGTSNEPNLKSHIGMYQLLPDSPTSNIFEMTITANNIISITFTDMNNAIRYEGMKKVTNTQDINTLLTLHDRFNIAESLLVRLTSDLSHFEIVDKDGYLIFSGTLTNITSDFISDSSLELLDREFYGMVGYPKNGYIYLGNGSIQITDLFGCVHTGIVKDSKIGGIAPNTGVGYEFDFEVSHSTCSATNMYGKIEIEHLYPDDVSYKQMSVFVYSNEWNHTFMAQTNL